MKTKNNIQKTALAAVCGLIVIGFAVNAQFTSKTLFEENEPIQIAMTMGKTTVSPVNHAAVSVEYAVINATAAYLTPASDEPLHIEEWMTDESNFSSAATIEAETENPLQLESWMTSEKTFDGFANYLEVETEEELNLENWMLNENLFDTKEASKVNTENNARSISTEKFFYKEVNVEKKLTIEPWMVNKTTWRN